MATDKEAHWVAEAFGITNGKKYRLKDVDPADTLAFISETAPPANDPLVGSFVSASAP
jgi:hypothetical protein